MGTKTKLIRNLLSCQLTISNVQRRRAFTNRKKISNPAIYSLVTNIWTISSFNPESFGGKMKLRNLIFGNIGRLGLLLIWFTLNLKQIVAYL
jgi:hypothetical protein